MAFEFLRHNNPHYRNFPINEAVLLLLPENGIPDGILQIDDPADLQEGDVVINSGGIGQDVSEAVENRGNQHSYVFGDERGDTEEEHIHNAFGVEVPAPTILFPEKGLNPVQELCINGYYGKVFPCLFPYGRGDITFSVPGQSSEKDLCSDSLSDWALHTMRYHDARFSQDPRFRYILQNRIRRERALSTGTVFFKRNADTADIDIETLLLRIQEGDPGILKQLYRLATILFHKFVLNILIFSAGIVTLCMVHRNGKHRGRQS
jgi:hypothetical protein